MSEETKTSGGEFYTPRSVKEIINDTIKAGILDPAAGSGAIIGNPPFPKPTAADDYAKRFNYTKTPAGFAMLYRFPQGRRVSALCVRADKTAIIYDEDEPVVTITFDKDCFANSAKSFAVVRHALNGVLSAVGKKARNAANKAKRESEENA